MRKGVVMGETFRNIVGEGQGLGVEPLARFFERTPRFAVAFSGGCDSSYLLSAAVAAGCDVHAYGVKTQFQAEFELEDSRRLAREVGFPLTIIEADVLADEAICENPPERCYLCKRFVFGSILDRMREDGFEVLCDGTNVTDNPDRRPGFRALAELGVVSPLRRAGMTKGDVRAASRELGIFTADKPSFSCLAVHSPRGERLTQDVLEAAARKTGVFGGSRPKAEFTH
mgnify:FL=1